jgi:hypothetical protein
MSSMYSAGRHIHRTMYNQAPPSTPPGILLWQAQVPLKRSECPPLGIFRAVPPLLVASMYSAGPGHRRVRLGGSRRPLAIPAKPSGSDHAVDDEDGSDTEESVRCDFLDSMAAESRSVCNRTKAPPARIVRNG